MGNRADVLVVPAGPGDAARLAPVHAAAFPETPWSEADLTRLLGADAAVACLAASGPGVPPHGFVLALAAADEAEILTLAVAQGARRRGLARRLVAALVDALAARGTARLHLEVASDNAPALALYEHLGFVRVGLRRGYYQRRGRPPQDAVQMAKDIAALRGG